MFTRVVKKSRPRKPRADTTGKSLVSKPLASRQLAAKYHVMYKELNVTSVAYSKKPVKFNKQTLTPTVVAPAEFKNEAEFERKLQAGGETRVGVGAVIITPFDIGTEHVRKFNTWRQKTMTDMSFQRSINAGKVEAYGLLFLTLADFLGCDVNCEAADVYAVLEAFVKLDKKKQCEHVAQNLRALVCKRLPWLVEYSKRIITEKYGLPASKLAIKPNFIYDDKNYDDFELHSAEDFAQEIHFSRGGLLMNNFLYELNLYEMGHGVICEVLGPSGLPADKKWAQIDVGISFAGKRNLGESLTEAMERVCAERISTRIAPHVRKAGMPDYPWVSGLFYGGFLDQNKQGVGFEGFEIHIWDVVREKDIEFIPQKTE